LKYLHQDNQGPGAATNLGLKYVTGTYLSLLDADDVFLPGSVSKRAAFLDQHPDYAGVRNNGWRVSGNDRRLFITSDEEKQITDLFTALMAGTTNNWAGTYMVRTDLLFQFYPDRMIYPSRFGQNLQIILPVAYKRNFGYIDEPLMEYILQPESLSQTTSQSYEYAEKNAAGYLDIYTHMLDSIVTDIQEHKHYFDMMHHCYHRSAMQRALQAGRNNIADMHYRTLTSYRHFSINDRITYFSVRNKMLAILYRSIRKMRSLFRIKEAK
jgi:glycosyltransferase involved in cell wall biosynthesis